MNRKKFTYKAIEVIQTPTARPFYLLQDSAEKLLEWCDVPRKKEEFMAGYQRALDERHRHITDFFTVDQSKGNNGDNIIPSSIIIAARNENFSVKSRGENGAVEIEITIDSKDEQTNFNEVLSSLKQRLSQEELDSLSLEQIREDSLGDELEEEVEMPPESYLAQIVKLLEQTRGDLNNLDEELRGVVKDFISGVSKPGLILDGQHRVWGAKNVSDFPVHLPVVLLPGLSFSEQVFHFYVLNNKARPLNKTELRTIISTSLSKKEIEQLYDRFAQVGVTAEETEWTFRMNNDASSPFNSLIDLKLGPKNYPIAENVAYQLVSKFMKPGKKYKQLFVDVPDWDQNNDYKLKLFFELWGTIKRLYPTAWEKAVSGENRQILQKVNLINLQQYLFDQFNQMIPRRLAKREPSPFSSEDLLSQEVEVLLAYLKEEFFIKEWKAKGLDTSTGNKFFRDQLEESIRDQCSNLGNRALFKRQK